MAHFDASLPTRLIGCRKARVALAGVSACLLWVPAGFAQNASLDRARAYAAELASDAAGRSSWSEDGGVAGYRSGQFFMSDESGANTLVLSGTLQFRYYASFRSGEAPIPDNAEFTHGFQTQIARVRMSGTVGSPDLSWAIQGKSGPGATYRLQDAFVRYAFPDSGLSVQAGQYKFALLREETVPDELGQTVERSQVNEYFNQDRSQGVQLTLRRDQVRGHLGFSDGLQSGFQPTAINTEFNDPNESDYSINLRGEWMFAGSDWTRFERFTSWRSTPSYAGLLGAAVAYQSYGDTGSVLPSAGTTTDLTYTVDLSVQGSGWNGYFAFVGNSNEPDGLSSTTDFGFVAQGGYFVHEQWEAFARYDVLLLDEAGLLVPGADDTLNFVTVGVNYFPIPDSFAARLTADVGVAINETNGLIDPTAGDTTTGVLGDPSTGEITLRIQAQFRF